MKCSLSWGFAPAYLFLSVTVAAQVPVDHGVRFSFGSPDGVELIDVPGGGAATIVGPLASLYDENNAGTLDPVTGELWLGGINAAAGRLSRHTLSGTTPTNPTLVATVSGLSLKSIDFDWNGDIFTCDTGSIYQVNRATGAVTVWDTDTYNGSFNALCVDMRRNFMYVGTFDGDGSGSVILEYDLSLGPGPGAIVLDVVAAGLDGRVSGIDDNAGGIVYFTTWDTTDPLHSLIVPASQVAPVNGAPQIALNDVWFDRKSGLLHVIGAGVIDDYYTVDPLTGAQVQVTTGADVGAPSNVAVNDFLDRTEVFPQRPSASAAFNFEAAAHGQAGDFAGIAIVAINGVPVGPTILGVTQCDSGGFAVFQGVVAAGSAVAGDKFTLQSARFDVGSGQVVLGNPVDMEFVP